MSKMLFWRFWYPNGSLCNNIYSKVSRALVFTFGLISSLMWLLLQRLQVRASTLFQPNLDHGVARKSHSWLAVNASDIMTWKAIDKVPYKPQACTGLIYIAHLLFLIRCEEAPMPMAWFLLFQYGTWRLVLRVVPTSLTADLESTCFSDPGSILFAVYHQFVGARESAGTGERLVPFHDLAVPISYVNSSFEGRTHNFDVRFKIYMNFWRWLCFVCCLPSIVLPENRRVPSTISWFLLFQYRRWRAVLRVVCIILTADLKSTWIFDGGYVLFAVYHQ